MKFEKRTLDELVKIRYGKNQKAVASDCGTIPIYGTGGLMGYATKALYSKPSVLIGRKGTINKVKYVDHPFWTVDTLFYTEVNEKIIVPKYLYYLMSTIDLDLYNEGTTIPSLRTETLKRLEFDIPEKCYQKKVLSILQSIDDKIETNTAINKNLEEQAQAIFKSWFIDFEPFGGEVPHNWKLGTIDDLSEDIICGKTPSTKRKEYYGDEVPFVTIPDMHKQIYIIKTERYLSSEGVKSQPTKTLDKNNICVSCIGTAGLVSLIATKSQTNQQINSIVPKKTISPYYVYFLMKSLSETIVTMGGSGSTIVNLNKGQFAKLESLVPKEDVMREFNDILNPIFEMILSNQKESLKLANLRDSLIPKLMSGIIEVLDVHYSN